MKYINHNKENEPEVMKETWYAWYSQKQFDEKKNLLDYNNRKSLPYIYYIDMNNNIVQVTEVSTSKKYPSLFDDFVNLGQVNKFYIASSKPL